MTAKKWTTILNTTDVTQEILDAAYSIVDGWYPQRPIDPENLLERLETYQLADGTHPDFGIDIDTPAVRTILRAMKRYRTGN